MKMIEDMRKVYSKPYCEMIEIDLEQKLLTVSTEETTVELYEATTEEQI